MQSFAEPGEVESVRAVCPDCNGEGRRGRFRIACLRCGGTLPNFNASPPNYGQNGRGWIPVDDYTGREVGTVETGTVATTRSVMCDGCGGQGAHGNGKRCRHCEGVGTVPVTVAGREPVKRSSRHDALSESLRAGRASGHAGVWAAGSFAALERALRDLKRHERRHVLLVYAVVFHKRLPEDDRSRATLRWLARRVRHLDGRVRVPAELRAWQRAAAQPSPSRTLNRGERNAEIRRLREEGLTLGVIARRVGVSKATASRVTQEPRT